MSQPSFQCDPSIAKIAEAYSLDAVDMAAANFSVTLDWSEASIRNVEQMLKKLHEELSNAQPSEDSISQFAKMLGSYVGEVLRRNHGGDWGTISMDGEAMPGIRLSDGSVVWPWSRAGTF